MPFSQDVLPSDRFPGACVFWRDPLGLSSAASEIGSQVECSSRRGKSTNLQRCCCVYALVYGVVVCRRFSGVYALLGVLAVSCGIAVLNVFTWY